MENLLPLLVPVLMSSASIQVETSDSSQKNHPVQSHQILPLLSLYHLSNLSPSSYLHGLGHQDYEHGFIILQM